MPDLSILVVTASPDERDSTAQLELLVTDLRRRPGVKVSVWHLRHGEAPPWHGAKVIDDLRTKAMPTTLDLLRITPVAGVIRGRELRRWWAEVDPDVVLLDDGLGERLLPADRSDLVVIRRLNAAPTDDAYLEAPPSSIVDVQLVPKGMSAPTQLVARTSLVTSPRHDHEAVRPFLDAASRMIVRRRLGVPTEGPLVVGWGDNAWFDGPDIFVRTIWNLRVQQGVDAHGLWVGGDEDGEVAALVADETKRCDLSSHISHLSWSTVDVRSCGDAVLLPYRDPGDLWTVQQAAVAGCEIVSFPVWEATDPALRIVPHLDVEAAAEALANALTGDRTTRAAAAGSRLDIGALVDDLLSAIADARSSR